MHLRKLSTHLHVCASKHLKRSWYHAQTTRSARSKAIPSHMSAWQVTSFANGGNVELSNNVPVPIISNPHHVLVKVACTSVNPLDVEMIRGFGHVFLDDMRLLNSLCNLNNSSRTLPLILGRDFAGVVVAKGSSVTNVNVGDEVYGVIKPECSGCHAEYTLATDSLMVKKPKNISMEKASAILYTTMTAWSALRVSAFLPFDIPKGFPVLVIGASGGVGQAAVQLLKAWDCHVVATCRTDAIPVVQKLSADIVIDYTSSDYLAQIDKAVGGRKYPVILDAAGLTDVELIKFRQVLQEVGTMVTLRSPLLSNIDQYGLVAGGLKSLSELILSNVTFGSTIINIKLKWAYFVSNKNAIIEISHYVEKEDKLIPEIEQVYPFSKAEEAYERMKAGHLRGKIVIKV